MPTRRKASSSLDRGNFMKRLGGKAHLCVRPRMAAFAVFVTLSVFGHVSPAAADPKVYSPFVDKGELEIEYRGFIVNDDNIDKDDESQQKLSVGYGVTRHWFTEIYGAWKHKPGGNTEFDAVEWENLFQVFPQGAHWVDLGFRTEIEFPVHEQQVEFAVGPILEKQVGPTSHTVNLTFETATGPERSPGWTFEYAWGSRWRLSPYFEPGFQAFGEVEEIGHAGEREHRLGPVVMGALPLGARAGKLHYEAGWLFGLNEASPDGTFRFLIEYEVPL